MVESESQGIYEFGPYRLDATARTLHRGDAAVQLTPLRFDLLLMLVRCRGRVIPNSELIKAVWRGNHRRDKNNLENGIAEVRRALDDERHEYVMTSRRPRGYRFVAGVREIGVPSTMAVLPFIPIDEREAGAAALGRGMDDAIITRLNKVIIVRPQSATSEYFHQTYAREKNGASRFAAHDREPQIIGQQMFVDHVLDCRLRRAGGRVRIHARIAGVREGGIVWKELFDEDEDNLFTLEDTISQQVIRALDLKPTEEAWEKMTKRHTESREAYGEYKLGRDLRNLFTTEGFVAAIEHFKRAVALDPLYAKAHNGLADCYIWQGIYNIHSPEETFGAAEAHVGRALELDDELAGTHTVRAFIQFLYHYDFASAADAFQRAIALNPNYATAYLGYSLLLTAAGRAGEALREHLPKALLIDPHSAIVNTARGIILYVDHAYEESREQFRKVIDDTSAHYDPAFYGLGLVCLKTGSYAEAIEAAEKGSAISSRNPLNLAVLAQAYAGSGARDVALRVLAELETLRDGGRYISPLHLSLIYFALGDEQRAAELLKEARRVRDQWLVLWRVDPRLDALRENNLVVGLLRDVGTIRAD